MPDFAKALNFVLLSEGGKVDDPRDPGGRTNEGITQAVYDAWRDGQHLVRQTVYNIAPSEVSAIYRKQYADAVHFDDLLEGLGYAVFDAGVMSGPVEAAKWLQTALHVTDDGHIGILTLGAASRCDPVATINLVCEARMAFLHRLGTWVSFGNGWTTRVESVRKNALALAAANPSSGPIKVDDPATKPVLAGIEAAIDNAAAKPSAPGIPPIAGPHLLPPPAKPGFWASVGAFFTRKV